MLKLNTSIASTIVLFTGLSMAQEDTDFFDVPLEDLMNVSVVSMEKEKVTQAPGISSVYYVDELLAFGLNNTQEFLEFALGVLPNYTSTGITTVQLRGLSDATNQKILFLINGVPYWMPANGDIPLHGVPVSSIEKIEIIRGPASVVYGTNSSAGVVNLVTKTQADSTARVIASTSEFHEMSVYHSKSLSNGSLSVAAEVRVDDGFQADIFNSSAPFDFLCFCFPVIERDRLNLSREHRSIFAHYQSETLELMFQHYVEDIDAIDNNSTNSPSQLYKQGTLLSASYSRQTDSGKVRLFSDWNNFYVNSDIANLLGFLSIPGDGSVGFGNGRDNIRWRSGLHYSGDITDSWSFLTGVEYEYRQTGRQNYADDIDGQRLIRVSQPPFNLPFQFEEDGSILLIEADDLSETAAFGQFSYQGDNFQWLIGLRYLDNTFSGNEVSPRTSFVYQLSDRDTIKLLYTEGFNSPTFRQLTGRSSAGFALDVDVTAEMLKTWDLSYSYSHDNLIQTLGAFYTEAANLILTTTERVDNSARPIYRSGIEYDVRYKKRGLNLVGNVSYLFQGNEEDSNDQGAFFNPKWMANLGAAYTIEQHVIGVAMNAVGSRASVSSYVDLNLRYSYEMPTWTIFLSIHNLLDDDIITPNARIFDDIRLQTHDGLSASIGFTIDF